MLSKVFLLFWGVLRARDMSQTAGHLIGRTAPCRHDISVALAAMGWMAKMLDFAALSHYNSLLGSSGWMVGWTVNRLKE
jgi:hypothetical protein